MSEGDSTPASSALLIASKKAAEPGKTVMWATMWKKQPHVYFGHDAKAGLQLWEHATGLDTGAVYGTLSLIFTLLF